MKFSNILKTNINDKGIFNFDYILCCLVVLSLLGFVADTFMLSPKFNAISNASNYVVNAVSKQGSISNTPLNWEDRASSDYTVNSQLINNTKTILSNAGFDEDSVEIFINNVKVNNSTIKEYNYGKSINVEVRATFPYRFSNTINLDVNQTVSSYKSGASTFLKRDK